MSISEHTPCPNGAFEHILPLLEAEKLSALARVAYRRADGDPYIMLWLAGLTHVAVI
jgi:hypothetical protein